MITDATPFTDEDLAAISERDGWWAAWEPSTASGEWGTTPRNQAAFDRHRLLAAVRAKTAEIARIRVERDAAVRDCAELEALDCETTVAAVCRLRTQNGLATDRFDEEWEHRASPMPGAELEGLREALSPASSEGHRMTLRACRRLVDEVYRLRAELGRGG